MDAEEAGDYYDRAVTIVLRDRKVSTSYIQRRLSVGYNKAASLVERMEKEGVVSPPNHSGKREILIGDGVDRGAVRGLRGGVRGVCGFVSRVNCFKGLGVFFCSSDLGKLPRFACPPYPLLSPPRTRGPAPPPLWKNL